MLVTSWNAAMAIGGSVGGLVLSVGGVIALPTATALLAVPALLVVLRARRHGFPLERARPAGDDGQGLLATNGTRPGRAP
jgi:hypothetical protein